MTRFHQVLKVSSITFICILTINVSISQEVNRSQSFPRIGIIADCQYADQPTRGVRHYRLSNQKLNECVDSLNTFELDHVFHLGDFIDQHYQSFEEVLPIIDRLKAPHTQVLGNHDFSVEERYKEAVPQIMGLKARYFSMMVKEWKFIILDGNDVSLYAWPKNSENYKQAS
ncbi:MAG: metallophosphoesterase, partial [Marinirhabdus sp.]|nr:metallophosphoesterase [Marinirhabdus sp.]